VPRERPTSTADPTDTAQPAVRCNAAKPAAGDLSFRHPHANWNDDPKPFVWHKTADEILDSLAAYCQRINDSRH
jgi:hypothetical protein